MKLFAPRIAAVPVAALCPCNRSRAYSKLIFVASLVLICAIGLLLPGSAMAVVTISTVPVGNVGNANDPATGNLYGGVGYAYNIGTTEVTVGQYTAFLNAVATMDTYGLYNASMATDLHIAGILQGGSSPNYSYSVIGSANHPVTYVSWGDAARFANWLHNSQPTGLQIASTTEDGAYSLNGATSTAALNAVSRKAGANWFIPTENEWYKAAFHQPAAQGGDADNYWDYPVRTNSAPYSDQPPGATPNNTRVANFHSNDDLANGYNDGFAVTGSPSISSSQNYLTDVGAYTSSPSFYGTFDQGGNVWEYNEALINGSKRGGRGISWTNVQIDMLASFRGIGFDPTLESGVAGFRVASIPEPSTGVLGVITCGLMWCWRKRFSREKGTAWFSSKSKMPPSRPPVATVSAVARCRPNHSRAFSKPTFVLAVLLWAAAASPSLAITYTTLDDPLGTNGTQALGIDGNNIVGLYIIPNTTIHGYRYNGATFTTLDGPLGTGAVARGVSGGNVVGIYSDSSFAKHGFLYNGTTYTTLDDPLALATSGTLAFGIDGNNIVGMYVDVSGTHGFLYNGTSYTTLDVPLVGASFTSANGISGNNIVGQYNDATGAAHGFLYNGTSYTTLDFPGADTTSAKGIDGNKIVGIYVDVSGTSHGFLYNGTTYTTLDVPLVGASGTSANGIDGNNIVGYYHDSSGVHGYLATNAAVPEPASVLLGLIGAVGLAVLTMRRKCGRPTGSSRFCSQLAS